MQKIPFQIGKASAVVVAAIDSSLTSSIAVGGASLFACVGLFKRGKPLQAIQVNADNITEKLGQPIHPSEGKHFEHIRHVFEAAKGGNGWVINIPRKGMMIPAMRISKAAEPDGEGKRARAASPVSVSPTSFPFGEDVVLPEGTALQINVKDGDKSDNRFISLEKDTLDDYYVLKLKEINSLGVKETVKTMNVSFNIDAVNDYGDSIFISNVLDNESTELEAVIGDLSLIPDDWAGIPEFQFTGGNDGDFANLEDEAILSAVKSLNDQRITYNVIIAAGMYNLTALTALANMANDMRVDFFYDINGNINPEKAITEAQGHSFQDKDNISRYYFPYQATDPYSQMKAVWGLSGVAFKAKAAGVAKNDVVGGYHYSAAGEERGMINRSGIVPLSYAKDIDRNAFAARDVRINVAAASSSGGMFIDDALTTWGKDDDKQYQHVVSTVNSISRRIFDICNGLKHEPDGITRNGLTDRISILLDQYIGAGALVEPSNTEKYGDMPYILEISKTDKDLWQITPYLCVTGTSRRFVVRPVLIP